MPNEIAVSVVIPVYNEQDNLEELYRRLKTVMDGMADSYEIVFVDDGSSDNSLDMLIDYADKDNTLKVLKKYSGRIKWIRTTRLKCWNSRAISASIRRLWRAWRLLRAR